MVTNEVNKIDAIRDLIVGHEINQIQTQIRELETKFDSEQTKTQKRIQEDIKSNVSKIEARLDTLMEAINVINQKLDDLSESKLDRKNLQNLLIGVSNSL
jgi:TolA-binding protein